MSDWHELSLARGFEPEYIAYTQTSPSPATNNPTVTDTSPQRTYVEQKTITITPAAGEQVVVMSATAEFSHNWSNTVGTGIGTTECGIKLDTVSDYTTAGARTVAAGATNSGCTTLSFSTALLPSMNTVIGPSRAVTVSFALRYTYALGADVETSPTSVCIRNASVTYRLMKRAAVVE